MKLEQKDTELFYKLDWGLLFYVNQKANIIPHLKEPIFKKEKVEEVNKIQEKLAQNPSFIDSFITENPSKLNEEELNIIKSWKKSIKSKFLVIKHSEQGTLFYDSFTEKKTYAVFGLYDDLENIIPTECMPIMIQTTLLPFKGKIIYNGLFSHHNIAFGKSIRKSIELEFKESKSRYGIITSFDEPITEREDVDIELMKTYTQNREICYRYQSEINKLLKKNSSLEKVYYQSLGKSEVRKFNKTLSALGVNPAYFAVFDDIIIASGQTEKELRETVAKILPTEKQEYIYIFKFKGKK